MDHPDDTVPEEPDSAPEKTIITSISGDKEKDKHFYIIFLSGPLMGKMHLLEEGSIVLGRVGDVDIPINDLGISRKHCEIVFNNNGQAILRDLGSTNGTFLNGKRVDEAELREGDKIQISSSTILKFDQQDKIENIFHKELYKMAVVDALTGAYNKRFFEERVQEEFSYCFRNKVPLSLVMFDIDHFKKINDTYGHPTGDYVLSRIAGLTKTIVRSEDILARYGGEEFIVILKATDAEGAFTLAERLRRLIEESEFDFEGKKVQVTISVGVASLVGQNFANWETMLKLADTLLYKSKNSGRNRVSAG
ncbi:MAG TPA: GGDEF domain-containing protein [bacterium]|nr:GGDEF domain-containing protein [bacterium]